MTLPTIDSTYILNLGGLYPYSDGATRRVLDFSGYGHSPAETNFAGDDSEYVDLPPHGQGAYFSAANKLYTLASDADFDFTATAFSIEVWAEPSASGVARGLCMKGLINTDGWEFNLTAANLIQLATYQAAAAQLTNSTAVATADGTRHQYFAVRDGASVRLFRDGSEVTYNAVGAHINPVAPSARDLLIFGLAGWGQRARIWRRALGSGEIYEKYSNAYRI